MYLPDFDFRGCVALNGVDWDKSVAVFAPKVEFDSEAVPSGGRNTVSFLKSDEMIGCVLIKIEDGAECPKIPRGLYILMVGDGYFFRKHRLVAQDSGEFQRAVFGVCNIK